MNGSVSGKRIALAFAGWAALCAVGYLGGLHPSPLGLAAVVAAGCLAVWTIVDLSSLVTAPAWSELSHGTTLPGRGDPRLTRLHRDLRSASTSRASAAELHAILTRLVDERLTEGHGINRHDEPDRAAATLDPVVQRLLDDPSQLPTDPAALSALLDRIESL